MEEENLGKLVKKEIIVKFKGGISREFAKEFVTYTGDKIKEGQSLDHWSKIPVMIIEVPKGKEHESCDYYNTIRFVEEAKPHYKSQE